MVDSFITRNDILVVYYHYGLPMLAWGDLLGLIYVRGHGVI